MAVYTKLSKNELIEFFSKYRLGKLLDYKEIKEGIENTNYFIKTEKGKFILTVYEKRVEEKDLPFFMSLMRNLFDSNFPSPEPIINKNGNYITEILNKKAAIVSFLEGSAKKKTRCQRLSSSWNSSCKITLDNSKLNKQKRK